MKYVVHIQAEAIAQLKAPLMHQNQEDLRRWFLPPESGGWGCIAVIHLPAQRVKRALGDTNQQRCTSTSPNIHARKHNTHITGKWQLWGTTCPPGCTWPCVQWFALSFNVKKCNVNTNVWRPHTGVSVPLLSTGCTYARPDLCWIPAKVGTQPTGLEGGKRFFFRGLSMGWWPDSGPLAAPSINMHTC